jgi:Domain of unknown function (DUF4148)
MMRALIPAAVVVASALAVPSFAFAQSNGPVTRAEVQAQLVQLQRAGYNPASDQTQYPQNIQAAEARIAAQNHAAGGYGGTSMSGSSASGATRLPANVAPGEGMKSIYFGS